MTKKSAHALRIAAIGVLLLLLAAQTRFGLSSSSSSPCCAVIDLWSSPPPPRFMAVSSCTSLLPRWPPGVARLNDSQLIGTHNSYHLASHPTLSPAWNYSMESLLAQLDTGVRSLELDVHWSQCSFTVYHVKALDGRSTCGCLASCLRPVALWSKAHPNHSAIVLIIEPKYRFDLFPLQSPFTGAASVATIQRLQDELVHLLGAASILTPAAVIGAAPTLAASLATCGWPSARETRGGFLLLLDVWKENRAAAIALRELPPSEQLFFVRSGSSLPVGVAEPDAAYVEVGSCPCIGMPANSTSALQPRSMLGGGLKQQQHASAETGEECLARIASLVRGGYIVRTAIRSAGGGDCGGGKAGALAAQAMRLAVVATGAQVLASDMIESAAELGLPAPP